MSPTLFRPVALTALLTLLVVGQMSPVQAVDREGLLLEWRFDGNLEDSSGNQRHGTANGNCQYAPGRTGQSLALDGKQSFVQAKTNLPALGDSFTIECWVKPAAEQVPYADILGNHAGDFTGLAVQQEGSQSNHYYFTYGTGSGWVYSHTFSLVANEWQHLAITKSATTLRVFLNGLPIDSIPVQHPIASGTTPFMAGLGISGEPRCFSGQLADVRIWDRAVKPSASIPPELQLEQFVRTTRLNVELSSRWGLFRPGEPNHITFKLDADLIPDGVGPLNISFTCQDESGTVREFPQGSVLNEQNGYTGNVTIPSLPGFRRVTYQPATIVAGKERALMAGTLDYLVLGAIDPATSQAEIPSTTALETFAISSRLSLDGEWQLATDPQDVGRTEQWFTAPRPEAVITKVPWIIQDAFPGYHGLAWYWRTLDVPRNPHRGGRTLLRFGAVDYKADIWVNGQSAGSHEGGETPFTLDVTDLVRPGESNLVAVRVLNPTHSPIDGITLNQSPRRAKVIPYSAGAQYNHGGIVESVDLLTVPAAYIEDLHLIPDPQTGQIRIRLTCRNHLSAPTEAMVAVMAGPATSGETRAARQLRCTLTPGVSAIETAVTISDPHWWDLNDPFLYRVTARVQIGDSADEQSDRCGFRTFTMDRGYFRLNGRRIFLRGAHTVNATPVGQQVAGDPALFQRDIVLMKAMGFNCIRFIWGGATRRQLDMCDEFGLMAYVEHAAANPMQDSPQMGDRFDRSVSETIRRDRNHPSVTMWGLLNETPDGPVFQHALGMLPLVRTLDETRLVMLNSGRWDGRLEVGSLCNPGSTGWEGYMGGEGPGTGTSRWTNIGGNFARMGDQHAYPRVPHTAETMRWLRDLGHDTGPVFLTEYGIGSAIDLWRYTRRFEELGKPEAEDARYYRERLERFLADWNQWQMGECFSGPDAFFSASLERMAAQRTLGLNALRAAPGLNGHSVTGMMDHVNCGEGLFTLFRDLKPGTTDALSEGFAPVRLCLFAEPVHLYRGGKVRLEAVLANEDVLPAGEYPVRVQVIGPDMQRPLDKIVTVTIPETTADHEPAFALPFYDEEIVLDGPSGEYRFLATLLSGAAATGGRAVCHVTDPADMPVVDGEVTLWGDDQELAAWLQAHGIANRPYTPGDSKVRERILVGRVVPVPGDASVWQDLARRIAQGSTVVFLCPNVFQRGDQPAGWLPLATKGTIRGIHSWLYQKDDWAKKHPVFDGLPAGQLMDAVYYRETIPDLVLSGQTAPQEAICGGIKASQEYDSGLMVASWQLGAGRFLVNTLWIRESLGSNPPAERLLRNMLRWAGSEISQPSAELPADFATTLKELGYE